MPKVILLVAALLLCFWAPAAAQPPALVTVSPSATELHVGESFSVTVTVADPDDTCQHPIMDVTLSQTGGGPARVRFDSPHKLGPPGPNPASYQLTAIAPGTLTLQAVAFGESDCRGWNWEYRSGSSPQITVLAQNATIPYPQVYLPLALR